MKEDNARTEIDTKIISVEEKQKLVKELMENLKKVTNDFVLLKKNSYPIKTILGVILNGSIGFCGNSIIYLSEFTDSKESSKDFKEFCHSLLSEYLNDI
jgi:hypothetical protein